MPKMGSGPLTPFDPKQPKPAGDAIKRAMQKKAAPKKPSGGFKRVSY